MYKYFYILLFTKQNTKHLLFSWDPFLHYPALIYGLKVNIIQTIIYFRRNVIITKLFHWLTKNLCFLYPSWVEVIALGCRQENGKQMKHVED